MKRYLLNLAISSDQWINTLTGGKPDETISSRVGKASRRGSRRGRVLEIIIDWIFKKLADQDNHCRSSIEDDE